MRAAARESFDAFTHHGRAALRLSPERPALWIGLRMSLAMAVPLGLSPWLPASMATTASLAGYFITLVDKGGAYRTRARSMALASLGALLAIALGSAASQTMLAVPVVVVGFTACAFAHAGGATGASITTPAALLLAIACFRPATTQSALEAVIGTALGASWAMFLALAVWPIRVYRPGRRALANVLRDLAAFAAAIPTAAREDLLPQHRVLRERLETARDALVATRRGRGERSRGERLLALVELAERVFGKLLALEALLDGRPGSAADTDWLTRGQLARAAVLEQLADLVLRERPPAASLAAAESDLGYARTHDGGDAGARLILASLDELLTTTHALVRSLAGDEPAPLPDRAPAEEQHLGLRDLLDLDSVVLRHALRVAIASAIAAAVAHTVHATYSYWILLTVYVLLQPHRAATATRTIQRGVGTVIGAAIAALIIALAPDPAFLIAISILLAAVGAAVLQLNYGLFSILVTPTFILLAELQTQEVGLVGVRIASTLLGAAIAFAASAVLWPQRERARFDEHAAAALDAAADYLAAARGAIEARISEYSHDVAGARRAFGLELNNAELALERMIADREAATIVEPRMTVIAIARRLGGAINVLATMRTVADTDGEYAGVADSAPALEYRLRELAGCVRRGSAPSSFVMPPSAPPARLGDYLDSLTSAIERMPLRS